MTLFATPGVGFAILVGWFLLVVGVMLAVGMFVALVAYHVRRRMNAPKPLRCDNCGDRIRTGRGYSITDGDRTATLCFGCAVCHGLIP